MAETIRIKICSIQIKNFRSIRNETIIPKDLNIFVGLNDAGKSNILKALNLFFNGETDYGKKFSFKDDFTYLFPKTSHSTKEIKITIKFEIPKTYSDAGIYTWTKAWRTGEYYDEKIYNNDGETPNTKSRVPGALRRIKYRYVPAVKSSDYYKTLLGDLYTAVFSSINNPLEESVEVFSEALRGYTGELSESIESLLGLKSVLSFPDDLNDIFKALVFETSGPDALNHVPLSARGDGIQARHIPIILKYISQEDQKSRNKGSMRVSTIWGFEEPENGLELLKAFKMADEFEGYSKSIQIFTTTHSPAFYMKKDNENATVFFVSKKANSDETNIKDGKKPNSIAQDMGLMPLIAPFVKEQSQLLDKAKWIYEKNILTDVPTIMVEGETDIDFLKIAIKEHSPVLQTMLETNQLRIICKNDGSGTTQLVDWAFSWIYSGFKSKLLILFDNDLAGRKARNKIINNEIYITKQDNLSIKLLLIEPSEDIKSLLKLNILVHFEIEHLLSVDFWKLIKSNNYFDVRKTDDLLEMFKTHISRDKTIDNTIEDIVENIDLRDTIVTLEPREKKKNKIVKLLNQQQNKKEITIGLVNTLKKIEDYFA